MSSEEKIFDISFQSDGRQYKGWVNPSDKLNDKGLPSSFHVVLNEVSFGYLSVSTIKFYHTFMKDKKTTGGKAEPEDSTKKSVETGKKAIKSAIRTSGKPKGQAQKEEEKDAQNWRNEG